MESAATTSWTPSPAKKSVTDIQAGTVATTRGDFHADKVLICVGHDLDYLLPDVAARYQVQRCALQMALAPAPAGFTLDSAVLTGTSMTRYDGFTSMLDPRYRLQTNTLAVATRGKMTTDDPWPVARMCM